MNWRHNEIIKLAKYTQTELKNCIVQTNVRWTIEKSKKQKRQGREGTYTAYAIIPNVLLQNIFLCYTFSGALRGVCSVGRSSCDLLPVKSLSCGKTCSIRGDQFVVDDKG